jgi:hypothetical protein
MGIQGMWVECIYIMHFRRIYMRAIRRKMIGGFFALAAMLCIFMPGNMSVSAAETENDGVMGQSLIDETDYDISGNTSILKAAGRSVVP